jgi:predicted transglutaminase-like cysteine proteinase
MVSMWTRAVALAGLATVCLFSPLAQAAPAAAPEFGKTLPPIGFVKFCVENPAECVATGSADSLAITPEQWNLVFQVNTFVNGKIAPISDLEQYGQAEYWTYPTTAGDCEDYLLLKKRYLEGLGFPSSALLITVVLDEKKEGHAVLTLATNDGDFVLDNRRNDVLEWQKTNYTFLKRQSHGNPKQWVSLAKRKSETPEKLASR